MFRLFVFASVTLSAVVVVLLGAYRVFMDNPLASAASTGSDLASPNCDTPIPRPLQDTVRIRDNGLREARLRLAEAALRFLDRVAQFVHDLPQSKLDRQRWVELDYMSQDPLPGFTEPPKLSEYDYWKRLKQAKQAYVHRRQCYQSEIQQIHARYFQAVHGLETYQTSEEPQIRSLATEYEQAIEIAAAFIAAWDGRDLDDYSNFLHMCR